MFMIATKTFSHSLTLCQHQMRTAPTAINAVDVLQLHLRCTLQVAKNRIHFPIFSLFIFQERETQRESQIRSTLTLGIKWAFLPSQQPMKNVSLLLFQRYTIIDWG